MSEQPEPNLFPSDVERVARALVRQYEIDGGYSARDADRAAEGEMWVNFKGAARSALLAALSTRIPAGWKLVPIEPTPAMVEAGNKRQRQHGLAHQIYRAMVKAAPEAPRGSA